MPVVSTAKILPSHVIKMEQNREHRYSASTVEVVTVPSGESMVVGQLVQREDADVKWTKLTGTLPVAGRIGIIADTEIYNVDTTAGAVDADIVVIDKAAIVVEPHLTTTGAAAALAAYIAALEAQGVEMATAVNTRDA